MSRMTQFRRELHLLCSRILERNSKTKATDILLKVGEKLIYKELERSSKRSDFRLSNMEQNSFKRSKFGLKIDDKNSSFSNLRSTPQIGYDKAPVPESTNNLNLSPSKEVLNPQKSLLFQNMSYLKSGNLDPSSQKYLKTKSRISTRVANKGKWKSTNFKDKEVIGKIFNKFGVERSRGAGGHSRRKALSFDSKEHVSDEGFRNMIKGVLLRRGRNTSNKEAV
jgi:hypothetical protein